MPIYDQPKYDRSQTQIWPEPTQSIPPLNFGFYRLAKCLLQSTECFLQSTSFKNGHLQSTAKKYSPPSYKWIFKLFSLHQDICIFNNDHFVKLNWLNMDKRVLQLQMNHVHNITNGTCPSYMTQHFCLKHTVIEPTIASILSIFQKPVEWQSLLSISQQSDIGIGYLNVYNL